MHCFYGSFEIVMGLHNVTNLLRMSNTSIAWSLFLEELFRGPLPDELSYFKTSNTNIAWSLFLEELFRGPPPDELSYFKTRHWTLLAITQNNCNNFILGYQQWGELLIVFSPTLWETASSEVCSFEKEIFHWNNKNTEAF